jgi:hypothetical protein
LKEAAKFVTPSDMSPTPSPGLRPASLGVQWAALLAVPALCFVVGAVFLPRPTGVEQERRTLDRDALGEAVSRQAPTPSAPGNAELGSRLRFVGATLPQEALKGGARLQVDFFFEVLGELDRDWQMFVHVDRREASYRVHGDHWPVEGRYHTSLWQRGEFVRDRFTKLLPIDAPAGTYDVWVGFYVGDDRMPVTGGDKSLDDGQNRIRAGTVTLR